VSDWLDDARLIIKGILVVPFIIILIPLLPFWKIGRWWEEIHKPTKSEEADD